jgi:transcriptional regulator with XRE-family HTH domain
VKLDDEAARICSHVMTLLRKERETQGVSGSQLADRSGLNQSTISLLDRGERKPTLDTLVRIAGVLRIELGEILLRATEDIRAGRDLNEGKKTQARARRAV